MGCNYNIGYNVLYFFPIDTVPVKPLKFKNIKFINSKNLQDNTNKFFEMIDLNLNIITKNQYQTLKTLVYVTALISIGYTKKIVIYI